MIKISGHVVSIDPEFELGPNDEPPDSVAESTTIELSDGDTAIINPESRAAIAWAYAAYMSKREEIVLSITIDEDTNEIENINVPQKIRVLTIDNSNPNEVLIATVGLSAILRLKSETKEFQRILSTLQDSLNEGTEIYVIGSESGDGIIDAFFDKPRNVMMMVPANGPSRVSTPVTAVTRERAKEIFDLISLESCTATNPNATCIPFLYPSLGCEARAHEMCRIIESRGLSAGKIWIYAGDVLGLQLISKNENAPGCYEYWYYHVSPYLLVEVNGVKHPMIIDPVIHPWPIDENLWRQKLGPAAGHGQLESRKCSSMIYFWAHDPTYQVMDDYYSITRIELILIRIKLLIRAYTTMGPPYQC